MGFRGDSLVRVFTTIIFICKNKKQNKTKQQQKQKQKQKTNKKNKKQNKTKVNKTKNKTKTNKKQTNKQKQKQKQKQTKNTSHSLGHQLLFLLQLRQLIVHRSLQLSMLNNLLNYMCLVKPRSQHQLLVVVLSLSQCQLQSNLHQQVCTQPNSCDRLNRTHTMFLFLCFIFFHFAMHLFQFKWIG